jgi:hypothetical protein
VTSRKNFLDVQWSQGNNLAYVAIAANAALQRSPGVALRLDYTPAVNCWWEIVAMVGLIDQRAAAVHRSDLTIRCFGTPAPLGSTGLMAGMGRNDQIKYTSRVGTALYELSAGVAYSADVLCQATGGTLFYYQGPSQLLLFGKAWAR